MKKHKNCLICDLHYPLYKDGMWRSADSMSEASDSEIAPISLLAFVLALIVIPLGVWGKSGIITGEGIIFALIASLAIPYFLKQIYFEWVIKFHKPKR